MDNLLHKILNSTKCISYLVKCPTNNLTIWKKREKQSSDDGNELSKKVEVHV